MFGVKHGLNPQELCAAAGISPTDVTDRDSRIPYAWANALGKQLLARLPDIAVGIELGQFGSIETLGYLGQALRNCPNGIEALKALVRHAGILDTAYRGCSVIVDPPRTVEFRAPALPSDLPDWIEMGFVNIAKCYRDLHPTVTLNEARFAHERDPAQAARLTIALGCPVRLGAADNALVFAYGPMAEPNIHADAHARQHFEAYLAETRDGPEESFPTLVARAIVPQLERGDLSQAAVAKLLGLSPRSLRRKLLEHDTSYQRVVTEARRTRAESLLADRRLAIYEVAFALGYEDVSTFNRAFRQWFGKSPRAYRAERVARPRR